MSTHNIRDLLTAFSPSLDFFAIASGDGRIKIWDTLKGQLQTEFTNISATDEFGMRLESERGHLSLDYKCMKWVQLESKKKKKKVGSSLLALGTGNGDVLALDVSLGQLRWKVGDCHPGGITAISFSVHNSCIYTAGADGMVCQIDSLTGSILGKFKASSKAASALSISADGKILATASAQIKVFNCSNNKKIQKFLGHPVAVRCMIFSEDGNYIISSAVGEKNVAIWRIDGGKKQSASCVLSVEHPAIVLDSKGSDVEDSKVAGIFVSAISEAGICYFWHGNTIDDLQTSKPTKISLSIDPSISKGNGLAIFAAKFHHIVSRASANMLIAYGGLIKPSFEKLIVESGKDVNLDASLGGILLPTGHLGISSKNQVTQTTVTALNRANAEDAVLLLPKLYAHDKKRKHTSPALSADFQKVAEPVANIIKNSLPPRFDVHSQNMEGLTCIEDKLREAGILGADNNFVDNSHPRSTSPTINASLGNGCFSMGANMTTKKIRSQTMSMKPSDAYKLLESLLSSWRSRSAASKDVLPWIYHILVIHSQYIIAQESSKRLLDALYKMTRLRCAAIQPLLKLSGCLQLIVAQIDKSAQNMAERPLSEHHAAQSDEEEEDEDIDELVYGEDDDASQSGSDDDNQFPH